MNGYHDLDDDGEDGRVKTVVVNVLTVATIVVLGALALSPLVWLTVTIYRAIL